MQVLILEKDQSVCELAVMALKAHGLEASGRSDYMPQFTRSELHEIGAIVIGSDASDPYAHTVCQSIKRQWPEPSPPVIVMKAPDVDVGRYDSEQIAQFIEDRVAYIVEKPFKVGELATSAEILLERYSNQENDYFLSACASRYIANNLEAIEHGRRVASLVTEFAHWLRLDSKTVRHLQIAAKLHDLGKVAISPVILNNPNSLTADKKLLLNKHPTFSADIAQMFGLSAPIVHLIRHAHERYNGSGYPNAFSGEEIAKEIYILSIGDAYIALREDRAYKHSLSSDEALGVLKKETTGGLWHPEIAEDFFSFISIYGPELDTAPNGL